MDEVAKVLLTNGIGGVMAGAVLWMLYHLHTSTIPRMLDRFEKQISEERQLSERRHNECMHGHELVRGDIKETRHAIGNVAQSVTLLAHLLKHDREHERSEPPGPGLTKGVQP